MLVEDGAAFPDHDAAKLRHIADQCDEEADELVGDIRNNC
jgi:hypothetical protein